MNGCEIKNGSVTRQTTRAALLNLLISPGLFFPVRIKTNKILADCRSLGIFLSLLLNSMEQRKKKNTEEQTDGLCMFLTTLFQAFSQIKHIAPASKTSSQMLPHLVH